MSFRNHFYQAILFTAAACLAGNVDSAVFERDFVPGSSDGLLTYDDVNQRVWLDVTVFANQWSSVEAFVDAWFDPEFDFAQEFPELAPGGVYGSFTLASVGDVQSLAESAGVDLATNDFEINGDAVSELIDLIGATADSSLFNSKRSIGFTADFDVRTTPPETRRIGTIFYFSGPPGGTRAEVRMSAFSNVIAPDNTGLMLYRPVVPEPSGWTLFATLAVVTVGRFCVRPRYLHQRSTKLFMCL